jgi:hypothetical protein
MQANGLRVVERNKFLSEKLDGANSPQWHRDTKKRRRQQAEGRRQKTLILLPSAFRLLPSSLRASPVSVVNHPVIPRALIGKAFYTSSL